MSHVRNLRNLHSSIKAFKRHGDIEAIIAHLMTPDMNTGINGQLIYRNEHVCRRHLLIKTVEKGLKRQFNRVARRAAKRDCQLSLV